MGTSKLRPAIAAALALLVGAPAALADDAPDTVSGAWTPQWLVQLSGAPAADGASPAGLDAEQSRFRSRAQADGIRFRQRFAYKTLFNGVSVSASDAAAGRLADLDGVTAVYPVQTVPLDTRTEAFEPELAYALTMTGADVAQSRLGYTGRGVHVALIDSGIDYDHPDLGGCFGPGCRVTGGWDFVGDDYDAEESDPRWQPVPHPDADPDDCFGHGTHVAGIVGANGGVRGVAPDVTFSAYKVFGCGNTTSTDVMLAAMERAYRDGADVVNLSIGEERNGWPQAPTAQAAARLVRKGIVVVAAAGNSHYAGLFATGGPDVGEGVIATTSVDNVRQYSQAVTISPDDHALGYFTGNGSAPLPSDGTFPIARTGTITTPDDACSPLAPDSLAGHVALVRRGTCEFRVKAANATAAGAVGLVFYNDSGPAIGRPVLPGVPIPAIFIGQADGELINARLDEGPVSLTWRLLALPAPTAGRLSDFASEGLAADLSLKPEIAAPGASIRSTYPLENGGYAVLSGTSMASPHVAGAAALYLQAHPRTRARDVGPALINSADPVATAGGALEPVARQGAGLVDVDDAILATTRITPATLSLGDEDSPATHALTLANHGRQPVSYTLTNADALAVAGRDRFAEHTLPAPATVTFTRRGRPISAITVPARGRARVDVAISPAASLEEGALYGGALVFTPDGGGAPLRVPYAGYQGDYQAVPAMTPTTRGFPWLARQTGVTPPEIGAIYPLYAKQDAGAAFTLAPSASAGRAWADIPVVLIHLNNFARRIVLEVRRPGARRALGQAFAQDYLPRNPVENLLASPLTLTTNLPFDGTVLAGHRRVALPDGEYQLTVTVQRALAGRDTPPETWTSPAFRIDRPD